MALWKNGLDALIVVLSLGKVKGWDYRSLAFTGSFSAYLGKRHATSYIRFIRLISVWNP